MNLMRRAMTSIKRRPGKTLILLLLVFILGSVISGAIAASGAINRTEANLRRGMRPIVSFDLDEEALMQEWEASGQERFDLMTIEMVREIAALPYVEHYDYSLFSEFWTDSLMEVLEHSGGVAIGPDGQEILGGWFGIRGTSVAEPLDMREGLVELISGSTFSDVQLTQETHVFPAIISASVAEVNHLNVGSTFTIERTFYRPIMDDDWDRERTEDDIFAQMIHEFEVIGLFERIYNEEHDPYRRNQLDHRIYVPNLAAEVIQRFEIDTEFAISAEYWDEEESPFGENPQVFQTVMVLHDANQLESFRTAAEMIIPDMWYVADLSNSFAEISTSMTTLQEIADWILFVSIGATLLTLSLLIVLFFKDRRYEMGVYLALGEKKIKVVIQMLVEVIVTAFVGVTLAVFAGHFISSTMSSAMLRNELATPTESWDMGWGGTGLNVLTEMGLDNATLTAEEMMDAFDVSLDIGTIGIFYVVGLGAVILSTVMPVIYIVALKPKKVLM